MVISMLEWDKRKEALNPPKSKKCGKRSDPAREWERTWMPRSGRSSGRREATKNSNKGAD